MCVIILSASFKTMQSSKQNISTQDNSWLTSSQNRLMVLCSCACGQKLESTILIMTVNDLYIVNLSGYVGMFKFTVRWVFHLLLPVVITSVCDVLCVTVPTTCHCQSQDRLNKSQPCPRNHIVPHHWKANTFNTFLSRRILELLPSDEHWFFPSAPI